MARPARPALPYELLALVISFVPAKQKGSLGALMSVSKACYELASRRLYAELRVNRGNLAGVLTGLEGLSGACACPTSNSGSRHEAATTRQTSIASHAGKCTRRTAIGGTGCPYLGWDSGRTDSAKKERTTLSSEECEVAEDRGFADERYPNPASDSRKRALLALTRYLTVESVPDCECWQRSCPLNKALLPHVRVVKVLANVPQHTVVAFERRRRSSQAAF